MAARETGVVRQRLDGDTAAAQRLSGIARTQLGILKEQMAFGGLQQLSRTVRLGDGTEIFVQSVFGRDTVRITPPVTAIEVVGGAEEIVEAVNHVVDYVGVQMPNPVPYRGISIGVAADQAAGTGGTATYVVASNGEVLAHEIQNTTDTHVRYLPFPSYGSVWNGGVTLWVADYNSYNSNFCFSHVINFSVPEDCIFPIPPSAGEAFDPSGYCPGNPSQSAWSADWNAGVAAFNARRKAWFKKNSDTTIASFATAPLPASWDYAIKYNVSHDYTASTLSDGSHPGRHTVMPIVMSITSAPDAVVSDTSADLTQAGVKVTKRTTTFQYVDANGANQTQAIDGFLTQTATQHSVNGSPIDTSQSDAYSNWYVSASAPANESLLLHQFLLDRSAYGLGLLWNGAIQQGYNGDSIYGAPSSPLSYAGYAPPYPAYSNTLVGTAAPPYLQYHNSVLPTYVSNTAQSSNVMNNSAMHHVSHVELMPVGQIGLGMFADPATASQVEIYGKAVYAFDWSTGSLTLESWHSLPAPMTVTLPVPTTLAYNCLVGYVWDTPDEMWPDVAEYLRKKIATFLSGGGDQNLYALIKQAVAL